MKNERLRWKDAPIRTVGLAVVAHGSVVVGRGCTVVAHGSMVVGRGCIVVAGDSVMTEKW